VELVLLDDELEVVHRREPPAELPVRLHALLEELVDDAGRVQRPGRDAGLAADLADHVLGLLVLEGAADALAVELVALVVGAHGDDAVLLGELGLERDDLALEDRLDGRLLGLAHLDLDRLADGQQRVVDDRRVRVAQAYHGRVRLEQVVLHLHVEELRHQLLRELGAVDHDLDAGRRVRVRVRHQPSTSGRESAVPRRRRSGSSIPLASAIVRHVVASP
jgi:hypothetical protein